MSGDMSFGVRPDETHGELAMPSSLPEESREWVLKALQGYVGRLSDFITVQKDEAKREGNLRVTNPLALNLAGERRVVADNLSLMRSVLTTEAERDALPDDRLRSLLKLADEFENGVVKLGHAFQKLSEAPIFGLSGGDWTKVGGCSVYCQFFKSHSGAFSWRSTKALDSLLFGDRELGVVGLSNARSEFRNGYRVNSVLVMSHVETFVQRWTTLLNHFTESVESSVTGAKCSESALRLLLPLASQPDAHDDFGVWAGIVQAVIRVVFGRLGPWGNDPLAYAGPEEPARFQNEVDRMRPIVEEMVENIRANALKSGARSSNPETNRDAIDRLCALESQFRSQFEQSS
jgi:hypothetical protein